MGDTLREPLAATVPMPWSMLIVAALLEVHESVRDWPALISATEAVRSTVGTCSTVTVAFAVAVPPGPVTVMV